jgi:hypothetical protein
MANSKSLRERAKAARAAADKAVGKPKETQRSLAEKACELEEQVRFADWKALQEEEGYTVEGDSFATAFVAEIPKGPTYDEEPGK